MSNFEQESLDYHKAQNEFDTNGKTGTLLTKSCSTQEELALAYSPGVAFPCLEIEKDIDRIKRITSKKVVVGFGIASGKHIKSMYNSPDGFVVGSAVVKRIEREDYKGLESLLEELKEATKLS